MRPLKKIININALLHNFHTLSALAPKRNLMPVLKANAYGHDVKTIAKALNTHAKYYAVACIEEAMEIRESAINTPIFLLEGVFSTEEWALCQKHNFIPILHNKTQLKDLKQLKIPLKFWLKIDSGMHRLGFSPQELPKIINYIKEENLNCQGILSHFASADSQDPQHTQKQLDTLKKLQHPTHWKRSFANSAALFEFKDSHGDIARAGIALYGISPFAHKSAQALKLKAVMQLESQILSTHYLKKGESAGYSQSFIAKEDGYLATIALGYGDGFKREIPSGEISVYIQKNAHPLVGNIAMDMALVWLGKNPYPIGERVIIFGKEQPIEILAKKMHTIPYTLCTMLTPRVHLEIYPQ